MQPTPTITIAYGDGIGPEIMEAALMVLREAGANITVETIEIGARIYAMEVPHGILPGAWDSLNRTHVLLKTPLIVPDIKGYEDTGSVIRQVYGLENTILVDDVVYNVNESFALFEVSHTAMPELAGKNKANPSAMLQACAMMIAHIGQPEVSIRIRNAWQMTLDEGIHTADIYDRQSSTKKVGTREFAEAVIERLYKKPLQSLASDG